MPYNTKALTTECYADTAFVEILMELSPMSLNKQHGVSKVAHTMQTVDIVRMGVIDGDRYKNIKTPYFKEFQEIENHEESLILLNHPQKQQHLIIIEPAIETLLLNSANAVNLTEDNFPSLRNIDTMKNLCKSQNLYKNQEFRNLVKAIKRKEAPQTVTIADWISSVMEWENPYHK